MIYFRAWKRVFNPWRRMPNFLTFDRSNGLKNGLHHENPRVWIDKLLADSMGRYRWKFRVKRRRKRQAPPPGSANVIFARKNSWVAPPLKAPSSGKNRMSGISPPPQRWDGQEQREAYFSIFLFPPACRILPNVDWCKFPSSRWPGEAIFKDKYKIQVKNALKKHVSNSFYH